MPVTRDSCGSSLEHTNSPQQLHPQTPPTHTHTLPTSRFPDFSLLSPSNDYTSVIDALFISHFHMDHVGALPYFTEVRVCGGAAVCSVGAGGGAGGGDVMVV